MLYPNCITKIRKSPVVEYFEWPAAHVRAGRQFAPLAEAELGPTLGFLATRLPNTDGTVHAVREFSGVNGIADMVALVSAGSGLNSRLLSGVPFISSVAEARVAAAFSTRRKSRLDRAAERLDMSERQVRTTVARLVASGALHRHGSYVIRDPSIQPVGNMYALEAKVVDWRKGMTQALRYSTWSDAAAIVLAKKPYSIDSAGTRARAFGIGMAVDAKWLVRPRLRRPDPGLRLLASELFIASVAEVGHHNPSAEA